MDKLIEFVVGLIKQITGNNALASFLLVFFIASVIGSYFIYDKLIQSIQTSNIETLHAIDKSDLKQLKRQLMAFEWEKRSYSTAAEVPEHLHHKIDIWEQAVEELEAKTRVVQ